MTSTALRRRMLTTLSSVRLSAALSRYSRTPMARPQLAPHADPWRQADWLAGHGLVARMGLDLSLPAYD